MRNKKVIVKNTRTKRSGKNNKNNSNIKIALIFILLFVIVIGAINISNSFSQPKIKGEVNITIDKGSGLSQISDVLEENDIINSTTSFKIYCKVFSDSSKFQAGQYKIERPISMKDLTNLLIKGSNVDEGVKVTIPEGFVITQIATLLESKELGNKAEFLDLAKEGEFEYEFLDFDAPSSLKYKLEGFVYPDTYYFYPEATSEEILKVLLDTFESKVWTKLKTASNKNGYDYFQILTLASIVEKEAVVDDERAKIAGVFFNRLDIDMSLQSCATVQYALNKEKFSKVVTIAETQITSPYNTYKYPGLPPGPICNPGIKSIEAAINPDNNKYLFFVAKGDGTHYFSLTYEEHLNAIQKYQK
ncbi:MAG: endolytic transglycosylase MltG [Firmicutes bacterium]|nr:endolytic transglycosylase MltG [Bacillota bacterium]